MAGPGAAEIGDAASDDEDAPPLDMEEVRRNLLLAKEISAEC